MAIHEERPLSHFGNIVILTTLFLSVCFLPLIGLRELFGREADFAAIASEISWRNPFPIAQGELLPYRYPLFPLIARSFMDLGLTPEWALRLMGLISLLAMACMAYDAAARALKRLDAGAIAAAVVLTNAFMIDRALWGVPELMGSALVTGAWLLLFTFGMVYNRWGWGWFCAGVLTFLSFLTIGPGGPFLFIIPVLLIPRPFSGLKRLLAPEGITALCSVLGGIMIWEVWRLQGVPEASAHETVFGIFTRWSNTSFLWALGAPLDVLVRFLPWSLMLYPAFCPAYKQFETNPVFMRYIKTLFLGVLAIIIFIPWFRIADDAKMLTVLFALLFSVHYPIFIRRNGTFILKIMQPLNLLLLLTGLLLLGYHSIAPQLNALLSQISAPSGGTVARALAFFERHFSDTELLGALHPLFLGMAGYVILIALLLLSPFGRRLPIWAQIALFMAACAQITWGTGYYSRIALTPQHDAACRIEKALRTVTQEPISELTLYKDENAPVLYAEGVYLGAKIVRVKGVSDIPQPVRNVFLISSDVPVPAPGITWDDKPLLRETYRGKLFLWLGTASSADTIRSVEKPPVLLLP